MKAEFDVIFVSVILTLLMVGIIVGVNLS